MLTDEQKLELDTLLNDWRGDTTDWDGAKNVDEFITYWLAGAGRDEVREITKTENEDVWLARIGWGLIREITEDEDEAVEYLKRRNRHI